MTNKHIPPPETPHPATGRNDADLAGMAELLATTFDVPIAAIRLSPAEEGGSSGSGGDVVVETDHGHAAGRSEGGWRFRARAPLYGPAGEPLGWLDVADDAPRPEGITPHQRLLLRALARQLSATLVLRRTIAAQASAIETLDAEHARHRTLLDSMDVGFCVIEMLFDATGRPRDYRFLETNPAFVAHTGLADPIGRTIREMVPTQEQHWFDFYGAIAMEGAPRRFEETAAGIDGRRYEVHAVRIGLPEARQVAVFFSDITARYLAETALRQLNASLDARVNETVAEREAAKDALRQSQKLEAIGQLTGGVAHDFNNLLTVVRGSVDLLKRKDLPPERRDRYIDAIADTADRAARVTGQLLAFARRQALTPVRFDVGESLREVCDMLGSLVGARIAIDLDLPDAAFPIVADRAQFDTAIVNIGINARDAMDGEGRLRITVTRVNEIPAIRSHGPTPGQYVAVTLADTGAGIAPENIGRIFEPFFTTKSVGEGTGLGLSQVIGFTKQSGGDVGVESIPGAGTSLTLYLPWGGETAETARPAIASTTAPADGGGACVLVVEDNQQVGAFATQALRELGYESVMACNAARAIAELERDPARFSVVFSDVMMPGMNGLELGHEIRRRHPGLPVVLTSGYSKILARQGRQAFELLHKPYSVDQLAQVLHRAIAGVQPRPPSPARAPGRGR